MSAAASGQKYNVYSSVGYLNEKGYVKATGYERFSPMDILCSSNFPGVSEASSLLQEICNKDSMK
ncbi:hypothetical protein PZH42_29580, partial [Bacteroides cellulosilyticus]